MSESSAVTDAFGVVTQPEVDLLEQRVKELFNSGDCVEALPVLEDYMEKSNWMANLNSATLEPYYNADYDDRKNLPHARLQPLVPLEKLANSYKKKRNIAYAMWGECLMSTGNTKRAAQTSPSDAVYRCTLFVEGGRRSLWNVWRPIFGSDDLGDLLPCPTLEPLRILSE